MIAVIDYGMGNLRSVEKALEKVGAKDVMVTSNQDDINKADKLVMPGVGAMPQAINELTKRNLLGAVKNNIFKKPYLGICLGFQLLFNVSEEGKDTKGLGILEGEVLRFSGKVKIPHMGWNQISVRNRCSILEGLPDNTYFYFCHSYYAKPADKNIIAATCDYGGEFVSIVCKDNLFAVQFHPEKSQKQGLAILQKFVKL